MWPDSSFELWPGACGVPVANGLFAIPQVSPTERERERERESFYISLSFLLTSAGSPAISRTSERMDFPLL